MKPLNWIATQMTAVTLCVAAEPLYAQTAATVQSSPTTLQTTNTPPQDTPFVVVSRGPNSRTWERTMYEQGGDGQWVPRIHRYEEWATGMHYRGLNGDLIESQEEIEPASTGGAQSVHGQHQVYYPYDIYDGVIQLVTASGEHLNSRPVGISYFDGTNSVLIAELTNSIGTIVSANQILYTNAFTGVSADLLITYRIGGLECDLVFRSQPPVPQAFSISSANCRLQLLTEFFETPDPVQTLASTSSPGRPSDASFEFGSMTMPPGKAFEIGTQDPKFGAAGGGIPVYKTWTHLDGRTFLIEEVMFSDIQPMLQTLPSTTTAAVTAFVSANSVLHRVSASRLLPAARIALRTTNVVQFAKVEAKIKPAVDMDYNIVNSQSNLTFRGDTTYYVSRIVSLTGTTVIEGGSVIKMTNYGIGIGGPLICNTKPYHPAVFTSVNDNSVGEAIGSGSPSGYYGGPFLSFASSATSSVILSNLRFCYASTALSFYNTQATLYDVQFVNCLYGMFQNSSSFLRNVLFANTLTNFTLLGASVDAQNVTFAGSDCVAFDEPYNPSVTFTNCTFVNVLNLTNGPWTGPINGGNNGFYNSPAFGANSVTNQSYPFQTAGAGSYYLTNGCSFTNAGTTNIDPVLLADLAQKTTYPPIVYSNLTISANTNFPPQAPRDMNALALGYHYDPLDYCFGGVVTPSNLTFTASTAVGWFELDGAGGWGFGIRLSGIGTLNFNGLANAPCTLARYSSVQETGNGQWKNKGWFAAVTTVAYNSTPLISTAHFTRFAELAADPNDFSDYYSEVGIVANNCEFWSGNNNAYYAQYLFTNCLFDRIEMGIHGNSPSVFAMRNCTMHGGWLDIEHWSSTTWPVWIENCAFDSSTNYAMDDYSGGNTNITYCNFNAFLNGAQRLIRQGNNDVVITNTYTWQPGPLGTFYQATNSQLINTGSVAASVVGLYHFTVQTNEVPEGTNIVSIAYHYVALDTNGNPLDNNGDGIPDYLEDANGNGRDDPGETPWDIAVASQPQSINVAQGQPVTFSVTAAGTGPFTYQWKTNGISIPGAILSSYSESVVQPGEDGTVYSVLVSNLDGCVTSSNAVLSVTTPLSPINGGGPVSQTVLQGTNVSFTNNVNGNYLVYQWYGPGGQLNNGSKITGARSSVLTISTVAGSDAGGYYAIVTNLFGSLTSSVAILTVITNPAVSSAPTNETAIQSDDVTFTVVAGGAGLGYQWWLTNGSGTNAIVGATSSSYTKLVVQTNDAGFYAVIITNAAGSTNASASLTVLVPPWITNQPVSVTTNQGDNVTFSVGAFGTTNLFYQWFKNGTNAIANATNASLPLLNVQPADAAGYSVTVTNVAGTNVSAWAWLSVKLTGGGTTNGWGAGSGPPTNTPVVFMISPANIYPTNPAIYVRPLGQTNGPPMSIRAGATSPYDYVTNVAFYTGTNLQTCTNLLGSAIPGANTKFAYAWTNSLHGTNLLRAVATDNVGLVSTSAPVYVVIDDAPTNSAGSDQVLLWPSGTVSTNVNLAGVVTDDGLPYGVTNTQWSLASEIGPGTVTFSNRLATNTIATFTGYGAYVLQLEADDGFATNSAKCNVTFRSPPGISIVTPTNNSVFLTGGSITLDALAYGSNSTISTVDFYDGPNHLTNGIQALNNHYRNSWANASLWTHLITAVAQDNNGLMATSAVVNVTVVPPLAAWITSPTNTQLFPVTPTNILLTAVVSNYAGYEVTNVSFSNRLANLGAATNAGGYTWQLLWGATNGTYTITVVALDAGGNSAVNSITITNNSMPTISITSPTNLASFREVTNVTIRATASDTDGSVTNVAFYGFGTNLPFMITTNNTTNYSLTWSNLVAADYPFTYYPITAVATDNRGASSVSQIVVFKVTPTNAPPFVAITYPTNTATFPDGADITITAVVTNGSGTVTNVEFFVDGQSIGSDAYAPYSITRCCWKKGTYSLTAVATDNLGGVAYSAVVHIVIGNPSELPGSGYWDAMYAQSSPLTGLNNESPEPRGLTIGSDGTIYVTWCSTCPPWMIDSNGVWQEMDGTLVPRSYFETLFAYDTNVFAATYYDSAGEHVIAWNGTDWEFVGNLFQGYDGYFDVWAMTEVDGNLYMGGSFYETITNGNADTNVQFVAELDTMSNQWVPVGNGLNGIVYAMAVLDGKLIIGGAFTNAGGDTNANYVAELDGNSWKSLGTGVAGLPGTSSTVRALVACGDQLFVGGNFTIAGTITNVGGVAIWNGNEWSGMGGGITAEDLSGRDLDFWGEGLVPQVTALAVRGNRVFIGGDFTNVFSGNTIVPAINIASAFWSESQQQWIWSAMDGGVWDGPLVDDPESDVQSLAIRDSSDPNKYEVVASGYFDVAGASGMAVPLSAVWRVGYPGPTNAPVVTVVNPVSPALYTNPCTIYLSAIATSSYTNIHTADFLTNGVEVGSIYGSRPSDTNPFAFTNEWDSPVPGLYSIAATATDDNKLSGGAAPLIVCVKDPLNSIVAVNDEYSIIQGTLSVALQVLTNDSPSTGLLISKVTRPSLGTVSISHNGKYLTYTPLPNIFGTDVFYYGVTNSSGASDSACVIVNILAPPSAEITSPQDGDTVNLSTVVSVSALGVNGSAPVTNTAIYVSGLLIGQNATNTATTNWSTSAVGFYALTASAVDANGLASTSAPVTVIITNSSTATTVLIANISNLPTTNTALGTLDYPIVTKGFFDLQGTASDSHAGDPVSYQVLVHPFENEDVVLANVTPPPLDAMGFHHLSASVSSGDLGTNDFSTLPNGFYDLELIVRGGGGQTNTTNSFQLQSNLKIGQFSFSEQDLTLPVSGLPLTVTRTYNSLNPLASDFGYSWSLAINSMDVQLDEQREDVTIGGTGDPIGGGGGSPRAVSVRTGGGRDVTLTLPDGRRVTFQCTFDGPNGFNFNPKWNAPPSVNYDLQPNTTQAPFFQDVFGYENWNNVENLSFDLYDVPGWILTSHADGTQYYITRQANSIYLDTSGVGTNWVQYDAYGPPALTEIKQVSGDRIMISSNSIQHYDPAGNPTRSILFDRDGQGRIKALHDPNGGSNGLPTVQYLYDNDNNNLVQVLKLVDRNAGTYTTNKYHYDNPNLPHYITSIENGDGIPVARNYYDDSGRLIEVDDANGNKTLFAHSTTNNTESVIDRLGHTNSYVYDLSGNVIAQTNALGQVTTMGFDANNNKTNQIAYLNGVPYATNSYSYDPTSWLLLSSTDPLGYTITSAYNSFGEVTNSIDANGNSTTNYYDNYGNLTGTVDALGDTNANFYNSLSLLVASQEPDGTLITNFYDSIGNLIATATYSASSTILSTNTFGYDLNGNRTNSMVWRKVNGSWIGSTTTSIYDGQNRVTQTTDPNGGTNTTVYNADGTQQSTTDALGRTTSYTYDSLQHLIGTAYSDTTTTQSSYDANGNRTNSVDQAGNVTTYVYDALNRLTQMIESDNTTNKTVYDSVGRVAKTIDARGGITAYDYDVAGRRLAVTNALGTVSQFAYDANGNQIVFTDATNHSTTNVFNALNRQVQTLYADGTKNSTGFDGVGHKVAATNQDGIVTLFGYDKVGRLVSVTNALDQSEQMVTQYQYDEAGNEITQIDALGRTNKFVYDGMGRRISHTMPGNQTEGFAYDYSGNLIYKTNFNDTIITNQYDLLNRLTNKSSIFGYEVSFAYSPTGQRTNMIDPSGSTAYLYDTRGRLTNKLVSFTGGPSVTLSYGYDADGNVTNIASSTSGGMNLTYSYDPLSRLTNVLANGSALASYGYDTVGNLQVMRYGTLATNSYQYDSLNRLTNLACTTVSGTIASFYYKLGLAGNRTNLSETVNGTSRTNQWQYDRLYRLTNEVIVGTGTLGYRYDPVGNRTNRMVTGFGGVAGMTNQSLPYNTNDWIAGDNYDSNGNTTNSWGNSYLYDALNHPNNAIVGGTSVVMTYDGDGNRVKKVVGAATTYYLVDDRNPSGYAQVLEEYQGATLNRVYNYGMDLISQNTGGTICYFGYDGHGSTRYLLNSTGNVQESYAYDAFGTPIAGPSTPSSAYLYSGQQFDFNLNLYYLRARYYQLATGRFWTMDSLEGDRGTPVTFHRYLYCQEDPVNLVDPLGLKFIYHYGGRESMYHEAVAYLSKSTLAKKILNQLDQSTTTYTIVMESARAPFDAEIQTDFATDGNFIHWSPTSGLYWYEGTQGFFRTPAMSLMHELGHAYDKDNNATTFAQRSANKTHDDWDDEEEKYNIQNNENPVAHDLGEPERQFHSGHQQRRGRTKGPTSIVAMSFNPRGGSYDVSDFASVSP